MLLYHLIVMFPGLDGMEGMRKRFVKESSTFYPVGISSEIVAFVLPIRRIPYYGIRYTSKSMADTLTMHFGSTCQYIRILYYLLAATYNRNTFVLVTFVNNIVWLWHVYN